MAGRDMGGDYWAREGLGGGGSYSDHIWASAENIASTHFLEMVKLMEQSCK